MTADSVRQLAQSDPVPNLTTAFGRYVLEARAHLEKLSRSLRDIDHCTKQLSEHGVTVEADLGPIGNAAAAARRDLERERPGTPFTMPKAD